MSRLHIKFIETDPENFEGVNFLIPKNFGQCVADYIKIEADLISRHNEINEIGDRPELHALIGDGFDEFQQWSEKWKITPDIMLSEINKRGLGKWWYSNRIGLYHYTEGGI